jgi:cell division protein FtsQ
LATSTSRLAELARTVRGRRLVATVILAAVTVAAVSLVASRSSLLRLRHLEVVGTSSLTRGDVVRLAALTPSTNVLWFDAGAVERRLESDPWVARATVSRSLPGTIRISVVERAPTAMIRDGRGFTLLAADGVELGTVDADPALPEIVLVPGSSPSGEDVAAQAGAARAVAGLDGGGRPAVVRAVVGADGTLSVELAGGSHVEYGDLTRIQAKTIAARRILRWARAQGDSVVSVNVATPDAPAATLG